MTTDMPPMVSTPIAPGAPVASTSEIKADGAPPVVSENASSYEQVLASGRWYIERTIEDVIKPSVKSFLDTWETNPEAAALIATPLLLSILLVAAFFSLTTLILVLWTILTVFFKVSFVIIKAGISLIFKLAIVAALTVPFAIGLTAMFVGTNAAVQVAVRRFHEGMGKTQGQPALRHAQDIDWQQYWSTTKVFARVCGRTLKASGIFFKAAWSASFPLFIIFLNSVREATLMRTASTSAQPPAQQTQPAQPTQPEPQRKEALVAEPKDEELINQYTVVGDRTDKEQMRIHPEGSKDGLLKRRISGQEQEE